MREVQELKLPFASFSDPRDSSSTILHHDSELCCRLTHCQSLFLLLPSTCQIWIASAAKLSYVHEKSNHRNMPNPRQHRQVRTSSQKSQVPITQLNSKLLLLDDGASYLVRTCLCKSKTHNMNSKENLMFVKQTAVTATSYCQEI